MALQITICLLHLAACSSAFAQSPTDPTITRLPRVDTAVEPAQFTLPPSPYQTTVPPPQPLVPAAPPGQTTFRRVQIFPRAEGLGPKADWVPTGAGDNALVITGGVNVVVQGLSVEGLPEAFGPLGDLDIETDRAVIWTSGLGAANAADLTQPGDLPLEIYMEGNIVFRQGDRTVYADRMFYDVRRQIGIILNGELLTPVPLVEGYQYPGLVRLRAAAIRQLDQSHFVAQNGLVTSSRLEEPSYAFAAETISFEDIQRPAVDPFTGVPLIDPVTNQPVVDHEMLAQSQNNFIYVGNVPVFYWPTLATDLEEPSYLIEDVRVRNDSIFGTQVLLQFNAFQIFGIPPAEGVEWDLDLDYLSDRGIGFGTSGAYARDTFFNLTGPTIGAFDAWFIDDHGNDNLGLGRRNIAPEEEFRGRVFWNHRQHLVGGPFDDWEVQAEAAWLSDRTFLEQYYEEEFDELRDPITGLRLRRTIDNQTYLIEGNVTLNDFYTQTQWLPRFDHYWLGEPLLGDQLTWFEHTSLAYADMQIADEPSNAFLNSIFEYLPWEDDAAGNPISADGERFVTRQEIDYPLDLAPFKVVPFALGELYHAGEGIDGDDIQRAYVHTGVRASIPFWYVDPAIRDPLFNLNGLAHKVVFDAEATITEASRDLEEFPLYDDLDDPAIRQFRRRMFFDPFGGELAGVYYIPGNPSFIDDRFDPRFYALRSGLHGVVATPSFEIVDDFAALRAGMHHRLQTKRGPLGAERIIDWLTFDSNASYFPSHDGRDFDHGFGQFDYDLRWFIGDRFAILSDGFAQTFGDGLRTASLGMMLNRPLRGNFYVGVRTFSGIIDSNVAITTINYRLSPKWIASGGASIEIGGTGNTSQSLAVTRIGESLNTGLGVHYDESRDNVGLSLLIEPRFLPNSQVTRRTGIEIPPAGAYGLE